MSTTITEYPIPSTLRTRNATPERWQAALKRAIGGNLAILQEDSTGQVFVTSRTRLGIIYTTDGRDCTCQAGANGDPICCHRALVWHERGMLDLDPEPDPAPPAAPVALPAPPSDAEAWAGFWADLYAAYPGIAPEPIASMSDLAIATDPRSLPAVSGGSHEAECFLAECHAPATATDDDGRPLCAEHRAELLAIWEEEETDETSAALTAITSSLGTCGTCRCRPCICHTFAPATQDQEEDDTDILGRLSDHDEADTVAAYLDQIQRDGQRWAAGLTSDTDLTHARAVVRELDGDLFPERRAFCEGVRDGLDHGYRGLLTDTGSDPQDPATAPNLATYRVDFVAGGSAMKVTRTVAAWRELRTGATAHQAEVIDEAIIDAGSKALDPAYLLGVCAPHRDDAQALALSAFLRSSPPDDDDADQEGYEGKRCINCNNILMGSEMRGEMCNACLSLPNDGDFTQPRSVTYADAYLAAETITDELDILDAWIAAAR